MEASRKDPHRVWQWEDRGPDQCLRLVNEGGTKRGKKAGERRVWNPPNLVSPTSAISIRIVESQCFRTLTRSHHSPASVQELEWMLELQNQGNERREHDTACVKNFQSQPTPAFPLLTVLQPHSCMCCTLSWESYLLPLSAKGIQTPLYTQHKCQSPERPSLSIPTPQL